MSGAGPRRPEVRPMGGGPSVGGGSRKRWSSAAPGRTEWEFSTPSLEEVEKLSLRFPEVVDVPLELLGEEVDGWAQTGAIVRSLGRRLSTETIARELRTRANLHGEVTGMYLDNGYSLLRFQSAGDRDLVVGRPWLVAGQALAIEGWRPGFFPVEGAIATAVVWVRLPHLPAEFWSAGALRAILRPAGELVALDDWTACRKRMGFARVSLRISLTSPLRPGALVRGVTGPYWQPFIYEGLAGLCLSCGRFHGDSGCLHASVAGGRSEVPTQGEGCSSSAPAAGEAEVTGDAPLFGPWLVAVRRWRPAAPPEPIPPSSRRPGKEPVQAEGAGEGWHTPAKLARRTRKAQRKAGAPGPLVISGGAFSLLSPLPPDGVGTAAPSMSADGTTGPVSPAPDRTQHPNGPVFRPKGPRADPGPPVSAPGSSLAGPSHSKRARPADFDATQADAGPTPLAGKGPSRRGRVGARAPAPRISSGDATVVQGSFSELGVFHFGAGGGGSAASGPPSDAHPRRGGSGHEAAVTSLEIVLQGAVGHATREDYTVPDSAQSGEGCGPPL